MRRYEYSFDIKEISLQYATPLLSSLSLERCPDNDGFGPLPTGRTYDWAVMHHSGNINHLPSIFFNLISILPSYLLSIYMTILTLRVS